MFLAKVIGHVVATQKNPRMEGRKLLFLMPYITKDGRQVPSGSSIVAVDTLGAGEGEFVMFTQGSSARMTDETRDLPIDAVVIGIVDSVEVQGRKTELP